MKYEEINEILTPWLKKYGLHVYIKYRGDKVRSIDVVDDAGDIYGLYISPLNDNSETIQVGIGSYRPKRHKTFDTFLPKLEETHDVAYAQIVQWIKEAGHTRTPIL